VAFWKRAKIFAKAFTKAFTEAGIETEGLEGPYSSLRKAKTPSSYPVK
jgi:hypothetical protein